MNAPTELYENHKHIPQQQPQHFTTTSTTTAVASPKNGIKLLKVQQQQQQNTNTFYHKCNNNNNQQQQQELFNNSISKNNMAKINWWYTPFKPLSTPIKQHNNNQIETVIEQTQHQQQQQPVAPTFNETIANEMDLVKQQDQEQALLLPKQQQQEETVGNPEITGEAKSNTIDVEKSGDEFNNDDTDSLFNETKPRCVGLLNDGEEDEMTITGYRRSLSRTIFCWIGICLTAGLLRLVLYWWKHLYLKATHIQCALYLADKVLIQDDYQGKHTTYYVKTVQRLNLDTANNIGQLKNIAQLPFKNKAETDQVREIKIKHYSVHFAGEHFERKIKPSISMYLFYIYLFTYADMQNVRLFICKQLRYVWNPQTQSYMKIKGLDAHISSAYYHQQHGLTAEEQLSRRLIYGYNEISVPYRNVMTLLFLEALNPFYIFQVFSVILWFAYDYIYYACVIIVMSIAGVSMSVKQTKKNQDKLRKTVLNSSNALVLCDKNETKEVITQMLVPGDIIEIPTMGCVMQCDAILLSGNCIVDESMLTGESVPITKTPLPLRRDIIFDKKEHARHTLFCGTKVIQTRYIGSEKVLAFVINTGNITAKGGLVRSIVYPPPVDYQFEQDSYKFIAVMAVIALIGFFYTLVTKIIRQVDPIKIVVESLDLITIVVPPALPAAMTVGRVFAQKCLKKNKIYCISPRAINVAGSIDCCCFDKTGTLTEEGLDMWGVVPKSATNQFQIPIRQIQRLPTDHFLFGMVTCHSITTMDGKMMGDPLDLKMFESTGWILEDPKEIPDSQKYGLLQPTIVRQPITNDSAGNKLQETVVTRQSSIDDLLADVGLLNGERSNDHGIVREFPFSSSLQRMSVISRRLSENHFNVYCKGAPEMLQQLCSDHTLPDNYTQQLATFAKQGYRIIALAYKSLPMKVNYTKVQRLLREQVECDLEFLGFVILENRLKPDTTAAINTLRDAKIRTIMVTGDNMFTALSVARDCGMVQANEAVITVSAHKNGNSNSPGDKYEVSYHVESGYQEQQTATNGDIASLNSHTTLSLLPVESQSYSSMQSCAEFWLPEHEVVESRRTLEDRNIVLNMETEIGQRSSKKSVAAMWQANYRFAMIGDTWQILREFYPTLLERFLTRGVIYARMSPEQKQMLIQELQALDYCVSMCGDGANDCGALKVAHTGISLSETESSIASPFTSLLPTIAAVPQVIKEGRAALITSFGTFKYMATYSMVQFVSVMILYSIDANLGDMQYLYIDMGLITVFAFLFSKTHAYDGPLSPHVPLSSLIALAPLTSLILHLLVIVAFQVAGWFLVREQPWFTPFNPTDSVEFACYENYALFSITGFQYIIMAFVYSKGPPYRRPIWTNIWFCLSIIINLAILSYMIIAPPDWLSKLFQLMLPPSQDFRYALILYAALMAVVHIVIESILVEFCVFQGVEKRRAQDLKRSTKKYMQIEYSLRHELSNWPPVTNNYYQMEHDVCEREDQLEAQLPAYIELRAEPQHKMEISQNPVLNSFFGVNN